jgi:hypothetical protein
MIIFIFLNCNKKDKNKAGTYNERLYIYDSIEFYNQFQKLSNRFDRNEYNKMACKLGLCQKDFELYMLSINFAEKYNYPEIYYNAYNGLTASFTSKNIKMSPELTMLSLYYLKRAYELDSNYKNRIAAYNKLENYKDTPSSNILNQYYKLILNSH